jgi:hypothetical protein
MQTFRKAYEEYIVACHQLIVVYSSESSSCKAAVHARMDITQKRLLLLAALDVRDGILISDAFQLIELEQELSRITGIETALFPNLPKVLARFMWRRTRKKLEYRVVQWLKVCTQRAGII